MKTFQLQHNKKLLSIFLKLAYELNKINILPITYGSFGLNLIIGEQGIINDLDLIISDNEFSTNWDNIKNNIMPSLGYEIDATHCQEFNGHNIPISILKISDIEKLTDIRKDQFKKESLEQIEYYNLSLNQYLDIYEKGMLGKYRKQKKNKEDKQKILLIKQHLIK